VNNQITRIGNQGIAPKLEMPGKIEVDGDSFEGTLNKFVKDVNGLQHRADESIEKLDAGEITDVHEVMIAVNEANTAMEFMLEIRNKIVEAYQEIMRMPV